MALTACIVLEILCPQWLASQSKRALQWIPELGVKDTDLMEPIQGVHKIARDRWNLQCSVCRQRCGAKIQCNKCYTAFHPLCGRIKGLTMDMREHAGGPHLPLHTVLLCHKHCSANPGAYGVNYLCVTSLHLAAGAWSTCSVADDVRRFLCNALPRTA